MGTRTPPESFRGKRWRCWLCGRGLFEGKEEWQECAVYRGVKDQLSGLSLPASPKIMPIYVHDRCLDAMDDELAKRIML